MESKGALFRQRGQLVQQFPPLSVVFRGSFIERRLRCGKPNCHCAKGEEHHTGYLTVSFARGRSEQVTVPEPGVSTVRRGLENYNHWWVTLEESPAINRELLRKRWVDDRLPQKHRR